MENGTTTALATAESAPQRSRATSATTTHKRQHSGGLLSRLSFLRPVNDGGPPSPPKKSPTEVSSAGDQPHHGSNQQHSENAMAVAMRQHKARKRKGSLRKAALLGTGIMKRTSLEQQEMREALKSPTAPTTGHQRSKSGGISTEYEDTDPIKPTGWTLPPPSQSLKLDTTAAAGNEANALNAQQQDHQLLSPDSITSPISRYASTTSDDDGLHMSITSANDLTRRRSLLRSASAGSPSSGGGNSGIISSAGAPHSSSDTEYWGWVILVCTWIVFVVGMGSCLGMWSWAWDVGETPYAPPEFEDDDTLPIVGYYPALIVCTGVMAWVWCLISWVGMKYFRHARFDAGGGSDDGD